MSEEPIFMFDGAAPTMLGASKQSRLTFRYFWRELSWERRRIVPALGINMVKAPFADSEGPRAGEPEVMWVDEVEFDGHELSGVLINEPSWVQSVSVGDNVRFPFTELADWIYTLNDNVFGAYTVNVIRGEMSNEERAAHDDAWGLSFGDPRKVEYCPQYGDSPDSLHPMELNMGESLEEALNENPEWVSGTDDRGFSMLHEFALSGNLSGAKSLIAHGADRSAKTNRGDTPAALAEMVGWLSLSAFLSGRHS